MGNDKSLCWKPWSSKERIMKYGYTIIYVPSVEETLEFYRKAFGFDVKFIHESKGYGELSTGETTLAFASHEMGAINLGKYQRVNAQDVPLGVELSFTTDDVKAAFEKAVTAGAVPFKEPEKKPWGQTVAYVRTPEGSMIELGTPIGG
jgi:lactoylglutathione lyase